MKKARLFVLLLLVCSCFITPQPVKASSTPSNLSIVQTDYGNIRYDLTGIIYTKLGGQATISWQRDTNAPANNVIDRGWSQFNISSINPNWIITKVSLLYDGIQYVDPADVLILNFSSPDALGAQDQYDYCGNGTVLINALGTYPSVGDNQELVLGDSVTDAINREITRLRSLGESNITLSYKMDNEALDTGASSIIDIVGAAPLPTLYIEYFDDPFTYMFSDTYYENGTLYVPPVNVTASGLGYTDSFNTSGGTTQYYDPEPEAFYWDIGGGYSRYIYNVGPENLTVTYPDGDDYTYSFTIKDLTGNIGIDSFLEAYRTINGTETLITRMPIEQPNPVPMNLVFGRTYRMKIRFGDGSTFDWGFLIPGSDTTITLLIRFVTFSDGAQILYNHITVDAVRTTGLIHMAYADDRSNTIWANVSIRIRNGPVVQTYTRNNFTYEINYVGFNDSLGYIVTFTGLHSDFGVWGRTFILDQSFTFPDPPSLGGIFGEAMVDFIPFMLTCVVILIFPVSMQPIGLIAGGVMASMMSFIGWASWSADLLYFYWFIAIVVNLIARGRGS